MRAIVGAGSIGLALAAQLARDGVPTLLVTRRASAADTLRSAGLSFEDPARREVHTYPVEVIAGVERAGERIGDGPVFLCTRSYDAAGAARVLATAAPHAPVVCLSNGLCAEADVARHAQCVVGGVWRQTCTRIGEDRVRFQGAARIVVGGYSGQETGPCAERVASGLRAAGLDVGLSPEIMADKWLKLCVNLMSAPNALIRREDHTTAAFVEVKARLLEEAAAAVATAGIRASSCDGRDRSLEAEIAHVRGSLAGGTSARTVPIYNSVWSALEHGLRLEAVEYHERILALARAHTLPAPVNERVLAAVVDAQQRGAGPESIRAASLLKEPEP